MYRRLPKQRNKLYVQYILNLICRTLHQKVRRYSADSSSSVKLKKCFIQENSYQPRMRYRARCNKKLRKIYKLDPFSVHKQYMMDRSLYNLKLYTNSLMIIMILTYINFKKSNISLLVYQPVISNQPLQQYDEFCINENIKLIATLVYINFIFTVPLTMR